MKRLFHIVLICLFLVSLLTVCVSAANVSEFADVKSSDWFYPELTYAVEKSIINGTSATTFSPLDTMSRAQFATVLGRAMGASEETTGSKFSDVENGTWFSPYVYWAVEKGIVNGTSATTFSPDDNIHREDMATMIGRMLKAYGYELPADPDAVDSFKDAGSVASYAAESVEMLRNAGILKGDTSGYVNPKSDLTRAEGMAVLVRVMQAINTETPDDTETPDVPDDEDTDTPPISNPDQDLLCSYGQHIFVVEPTLSQNDFFAEYIPEKCSHCGEIVFRYKSDLSMDTTEPDPPAFVNNADGSVTVKVLMTATTYKTITIQERAAGTFTAEDVESFLLSIGFDHDVSKATMDERGWTEFIPTEGMVGLWNGYYRIGCPSIAKGSSYLDICLEIVRSANRARLDAIMFRSDLANVEFAGYCGGSEGTVSMTVYYK